MSLIAVTELKIGDIVRAHGGIFEVISTNTIVDDEGVIVGTNPSNWIGGKAVSGYFGPGKGWNFQGTSDVRVTVTNR